MKKIKGATFQIEEATFVDKTTGEKKSYQKYWVVVVLDNGKTKKFSVAPKSKEAFENVLEDCVLEEVE